MSSQWPSESGSDEGYGSTFSETTKQQIRALYRDRCAICLDHLPPGGGHFAHLIASSEEGEKTVQGGDFLGIIHPDYDRSSKDNGYPLCTNCHLGYFKPKLVTLSPPWPILKYILESLHQPGNSRSIYQICQSLIQSSRDHLSAPEDVKGLIPYLGLYSLVILRPEKVQECVIMTCKLPPLSILNNHQFVPALSDVDLSIPGVARIFDTSAITSTLPLSLGYIPLTDFFAEFCQRRYWRIPLPLEAVLTEFITSMSHPCTVYAADTEEYYAVRIRLFSEFLKLRLQDMEVDGPLKSVEVPNLTGFVDARGADASGSADVRETGANGGQLEDHKEVAGELTDARQSDIGKKARSALGSDEIAQWAASATICPGLPNGDSLDAPLNNDMMENGHELSQTQSDYTLSAPEDVKPLL